jgi:tripartite-type tricarboxylate transporter receptor subunit TctC
MRGVIRPLLTASAGILLFAAAASAAAQDFYKGKTIRIVVGFSPGGAFDVYSRTIARHIGKHIAGNPTVIVENMPGAGSLILANQLFSAIKPDGLTIGNFIGSILLGQLLDQKGIQFDARKIEYLGTPVRNHSICVLSKASGVTDMDKWMAAKTPVKMGGIGQGTTTDNVIRIIRATLGLPIQLASGYKGMSDIRLATESGEVAGTCLAFRTVWQKALDAGEVIPMVQVAPKPDPVYPKVPLAINLAKTEEARKIIEVGVHDDSATSLTYTLPPGTAKDRVALLRNAFLDTMKDSEFLAEMKKAMLDVDPVTGAEVEKIIHDHFKLDAALLGKLKDIFYR